MIEKDKRVRAFEAQQRGRRYLEMGKQIGGRGVVLETIHREAQEAVEQALAAQQAPVETPAVPVAAPPPPEDRSMVRPFSTIRVSIGDKA